MMNNGVNGEQKFSFELKNSDQKLFFDGQTLRESKLLYNRKQKISFVPISDFIRSCVAY